MAEIKKKEEQRQPEEVSSGTTQLASTEAEGGEQSDIVAGNFSQLKKFWEKSSGKTNSGGESGTFYWIM